MGDSYDELDAADFDALDVVPSSAPPSLVFGSVDEFVREKLIQQYRRVVGPPGRAHRRWAAEWWRYPEAVSRLEALWRSWEHLRLDGATGSSIWWRDHLDPHMAVLMDVDGPFAEAKDQNDPGEPLPYAHPPTGMFPDVRTADVV
ncbi:protein of unknown function [Herbiconiux ginsengi]|uniref:DUF4913 domain-containing protein n=2 Tax=Herbiconiux ginsengi TaxID=381665 RepID=A0A1H3TEH3_9MICO|nr:protein of unknown function [Herbiconiux ginsengi]